jgi:hypothetical protein
VSLLNVQMTGVKECLAALKDVPAGIQRKHMRIAMNAAGGILKTGAVGRVPKRTGLLKQSLGVKVTQKKTGDWYVVVGAKRGMSRGIKTTRKGNVRALSKKATSNLRFTPGGSSTRINPTRYLHLVEGGTRSHFVSIKSKRVLAGNGGIWGTKAAIRAKPARFLAATSQVSGQAAVQKAITKLREAILSHANK